MAAKKKVPSATGKRKSTKRPAPKKAGGETTTKATGKEGRTMGTKTAGTRKRVKFTVQADEGSDVFVAGTFNNWSESKNRLSYKNGSYTTSLLVPKGRHEYKFVINGTWSIDPECPEWTPNDLGSLNSVLEIN